MAGFESQKVSADELAAGLPESQAQPTEEPVVVPGTEGDPQFEDDPEDDNETGEPSAFDPEKDSLDDDSSKKEDEPAKKEDGNPPASESGDDVVPKHQPSPEKDGPKTEEKGDQKDTLKEFMEKHGITSQEELAEKLAAIGKKPETPEEIDKRNRAYRASVDKFAQDKGLISREDIHQLENLRAAKAEDVVWNKFKEDWIGAHPDHDKATIDEDARLDFEAQYHLNSDNALLKQRGEKMLMRDRDEIVGPLEQKYADAEAQYNDNNTQQEQISGFAGLIKSAIEGAPKEISFGEGDDKVVYQLEGKINIKELDEFLVRQDLWEKYLNKEDIKDQLTELVEFYVWKKHNKEIASEIRKSGYSAGIKNGSNVGASAPFVDPSKKAVEVTSTPADLSVDDRAKAGSLFGGRR